MDDIVAGLQGWQVTPTQNTTAAPHPRFDLYKCKGGDSGQEKRRKEALKRQKERRFDSVSHSRRLGENAWDDVTDESVEDEDPDMEISQEDTQRPGKYYKDQLMLSEWMMERPANLEEDYIMVVCPVGRRCLVVASRATTVAYNKGGYTVTSYFPSVLPGGHKRHYPDSYTILDCIYVPLEKTFYVLDLMCWNKHPVYDSETEFRMYWFRQKQEEVPALKETSRNNPFKFVEAVRHGCTEEEICNVLTAHPKMDGLLFYHKHAHYTFGTTPLVCWLKPFMVPEILGVGGNCVNVPGDYASAEAYRTDFTVKMKAKEEKREARAAERAQRYHSQVKNKKKATSMDVTSTTEEEVSSASMEDSGIEEAGTGDTVH